MLSFILRCALIEHFLIVHQTQHCHLLLFADTFCGSVFPRLSLLFFSPTMSLFFEYDASGFCGRVVLNGSPRWLVLRLFPLPCHVVCHTFGLLRAALDQTGYASNSALSVFFLCQLKCCNASKAHWSHVLSAFTIITISIWMSACSVWKTQKRDTI